MNKILLVEDDDSLQFLYKRQLELAGYQVNAYATGAETLQSLDDNIYDLVLLDIMLPDMNGIEILGKIREHTNGKDVPVILLSNLGQENIIQEGMKLGVKEFVLKSSVTPDQLIETVNKHLHKTIA